MIVSCFECRAILERFSSPVLILPDHPQNSNNLIHWYCFRVIKNLQNLLILFKVKLVGTVGMSVTKLRAR